MGRALAAVGLGALIIAAPAQGSYPAAKNGKVVYQHGFAGGTPQADLFLMNADGSGQRNLTNTPNPITEVDPFFSPNAKSILFARCELTNCDIATIKPSGSGLAKLTNTADPIEELDPVYSPDGRRIAFTLENEDASSLDVLIMNADGSGAVNLTNTPSSTIEEFEPTFSPDGQRIYFTRCENNECHIWVMNANGSSPRALTDTVPGQEEFEAEVSPDGRRLVFQRCDGGDCGSVLMDLASGAQIPFDPTSMEDTDPIFSPDQRRLLFTPDTPAPGNSFAIWLANADASGARALTTPADQDDDTDPSWEYVFTCGGRLATIVGSDSGERIKGTKRADVIVANGGKDKVFGRGGSDLICGGKGKDKLVAGAGKNDRCLGGKGRDSGKGCERGKL